MLTYCGKNVTVPKWLVAVQPYMYTIDKYAYVEQHTEQSVWYNKWVTELQAESQHLIVEIRNKNNISAMKGQSIRV